jgi:LacI family transcriptional regulator
MARRRTNDNPTPTVRRAPPKGLPTVALLVETTRSYGRNVLRGIHDYAKVNGPWLFHLPNEMPISRIPPAEEWQGDGIIAQPRQNADFVAQLAASGVPVVSLSGPPGSGGLHAVLANHAAVADLAMVHFRERGFTRFAYCGTPHEWAWPPTGQHFRQLADRAGLSCDIYEPTDDPGDRTMRIAHLAGWLRSLRHPVGILALNDQRARELLDAARSVEIAVPEQVAVLGVNDDELFCEMADPPLSSIIHNAWRIGHEAAAMLSRLMAGQDVAAEVTIDPLGVHARQSTDLLAIEDVEIAKAIRFIRAHACEGIRVEDVLNEVAMSRRSFEKRFALALGRPPHMEIRRIQLERVKELLIDSDYKLERIAEIAGFSTAQYLSVLFHQVVHMTPGAWRLAGRTGLRK